jgi:hypothetical protein
MGKSPSKRRLAENQAVFRRLNETVQKSYEETKAIAEQERIYDLAFRADMALHFYCECADENCHKRIVMTLSRYNKIHKKRDRFIVSHGHEVKEVERVITKERTYAIVEKLVEPPERPKKLRRTNIKNIPKT